MQVEKERELRQRMKKCKDRRQSGNEKKVFKAKKGKK